jgi:hypothetical protein
MARHPEPTKPAQATEQGPSRGVEPVSADCDRRCPFPNEYTQESSLPVLLSETSANLQATLGSLSANLSTLAPSSLQNPEAISRIANAISEVTQALRHVEHLRKDRADLPSTL